MTSVSLSFLVMKIIRFVRISIASPEQKATVLFFLTTECFSSKGKD